MQTRTRWYVHTHSVRPNGDTDSYLTRGFDTEAKALAYVAQIKRDEWSGTTSVQMQQVPA